jgi:hypothetical protein
MVGTVIAPLLAMTEDGRRARARFRENDMRTHQAISLILPN